MSAVAKAVEILEGEVKTARETLDRLFASWDEKRIPDRASLMAMEKERLVDLIDSMRDSLPVKAKVPLKEECARVLSTHEGCQHLSWEDVVRLVRKAYHDRGLKCSMTVQSLTWYPSQRGYMALPRKKIGLDLLEEAEDEA